MRRKWVGTGGEEIEEGTTKDTERGTGTLTERKKKEGGEGGRKIINAQELARGWEEYQGLP